MPYKTIACVIWLTGLLCAGDVYAQTARPDATPGTDTLPALIPIFPLEVTMLFPGVSRPLHIFEPRYRAMVAEALKGDRIIGMATLKPGFEADYQGRPPVYDIGCAGEITEVQELPGGRYNIVLRGLVKFRINREDSSRPYRLAGVQALPEKTDEADRPALRAARERLEDLITRGGGSKVPPDTPDEELINMVAQYLPLSHAERQGLLEAENTLARARALIDLIEKKGLAPPALPNERRQPQSPPVGTTVLH